MFYKSLLLPLIVLCSAFSPQSDVVTARSYYEKAVSSKSYAERLKTFTLSKTADATMRAYFGVSQALLAKHHWNPYSKYTLVQQGLSELNLAALSDSKDVEIRFLRFSIEENLPAIVSFTSHISEDKLFILNNLKNTHSYYSTIRAYMLQSPNVSEADRKKL